MPRFRVFARLFCLSTIALVMQGGLVNAQTAETLPSVIVTPVVEKDVTPQFSFVGRVEAIDIVDLRARVEGFLEKRSVEEGALVKKGDLIFSLEKEPYEIVVQEAEAKLIGVKANLKKAKLTLNRQTELKKQTFVSQAALDVAVAEEASANGDVLLALAELRSAELNLSYTHIISPIDGQIGKAKYSAGNLVGPTSDPLGRITSIDPIYVNVSIAEKDLIQARIEGIDLKGANPTFAPSLIMGNGASYEHVGRFEFLDTEVQQSTDTILGRAIFPNPKKVLLNGQFVKVIVKRTSTVRTLVVPQSAIQRDQRGAFVLVVDADQKVKVKYITTGDKVDTDWAVKEGLKPGERVIVQGIQKVRPDMKVNIVER